MINVSDNFNEAYIPSKALLIYKAVKGDDNKQGADSSPVYVESYDIAGNGKPINAHPLSLSESIALAELLQSSSEMQNTYLKCKGLIPQNLCFSLTLIVRVMRFGTRRHSNGIYFLSKI